MLRAPWALAARLVARASTARIRSDRALAFLAARTLMVDAAVTEALDAGITQVVTVGAGYDSRPWRLARRGVRFVELDHPATQADKRRRAPTGPGPAYGPLVVGTDPLAPALAKAGWDAAAPGVAVVEGLTMYLDEAVVADLLAALASLTGPCSRLAVNFGVGFAAGGDPRPAERWARRAAARARESFRCELEADQLPGFLASTGWEPTDVATGPDAARRHLAGTGLPTTDVAPCSTIALATHR